MQRKAVLLVGSQKNELFNRLKGEELISHINTIGMDMVEIISKESNTRFHVWVQVSGAKGFKLNKPNSIIVLCPGDKKEKEMLLETQDKNGCAGTCFAVAVSEVLGEGKEYLYPANELDAVQFLDSILNQFMTKCLVRSQTERKESAIVESKPVFEKSKSWFFGFVSKAVGVKDKSENVGPGFLKWKS